MKTSDHEMSYENIREIRDTLDELMRMHQLNLELLDTLATVLNRLRDYRIKNNLPDFDDSTRSLLHRATTLYDELTSSPLWQCGKSSDDGYHERRKDGKLPEPKITTHIRLERNIYAKCWRHPPQLPFFL
jgi:hypothetical protein